jgi:hypothetical protein
MGTQCGRRRNRPRLSLAPSRSRGLGTASEYFSPEKYSSGVRFLPSEQQNIQGYNPGCFVVVGMEGIEPSTSVLWAAARKK